jgi:flagellar hook-basal body complex protein FliE
MVMSDLQIQQVLASMRALQTRVPVATENAAAQGINFATLLKDSLASVNQAQQTASTLATRFQQGDQGVNLPDVMISMQKASLQFEAVTQVRNRLVAAYQEIMNMQV